ncbi:hypothetical protein BVY01_02405 [bacterium I07]|nr:hypothetical protein BVY01_02405 [bacterium I07]
MWYEKLFNRRCPFNNDQWVWVEFEWRRSGNSKIEYKNFKCDGQKECDIENRSGDGCFVINNSCDFFGIKLPDFEAYLV